MKLMIDLGTNLHRTVPSASAEMTFPRADRDLLMFLASSSTAPSAPVLLTWHTYTRRQEELVRKEHYQQGNYVYFPGGTDTVV